nr:MAG TPA: hypothetical protein [Caudoviricetes sp.]DAX49636.1 MAG TPA: hypothetical protein [Caudoviricetes sp.]
MGRSLYLETRYMYVVVTSPSKSQMVLAAGIEVPHERVMFSVVAGGVAGGHDGNSTSGVFECEVGDFVTDCFAACCRGNFLGSPFEVSDDCGGFTQGFDCLMVDSQLVLCAHVVTFRILTSV